MSLDAALSIYISKHVQRVEVDAGAHVSRRPKVDDLHFAVCSHQQVVWWGGEGVRGDKGGLR